ncbi:MAG: recombinase family protein [Rhodospirillaceae bacterium]|nr:recombinase family protein [Rhodospirillaceae bacterium]
MTATRDARLTAGHLARSAIVYIRQSSEIQVRNNVERRKLQYALEGHARALGFAKVEVIDDDLGVSGSGVRRPGFERLLQAVCSGSVGLVLAIEASRLARNGRDWHALLEICAVVGCLVGDRDRIHDPASVDDRAFLGIKGQFADMELAIFRQRSLESREALAERGELFPNLPAGFEKVGRHSIAKTPDQHERDAIDMVFRKFRELRSIRQVHLWFRRRGIRIPVRDLKGISWRVPHDSTLASMLRHPIYAGAYVYGRRRQEVTVDASGTKNVRGGIMKPEDEWSVLLRDRHEGYIGWDEYERNRRVIEANAVGNRGAPRAGRALLAGLLCCGRCQRRLQVADNGRSHRYQCEGEARTGGKTCIGFGGARVDAAVSAAVLAAAQPLGVAAALEAFERRDDDASARIRLAASALEEARYKAGRAQAQFDAVDPANSNIFHNLAARWEACLAEVSEREERLRELEAAREARQAGSADRDAWLALGADLERAWSHEDATPRLRKNVLRAALVDITASLREDTVHLLLHWRGGDHTEIEVRRFRAGEHRYKSGKDVEDLVAGLSRQLPDAQTARLLNLLGHRTGKGNGWNRDRVRAFRCSRGIPVYREGERQERGELSLSEASAQLGVDPSVVRRLIRAAVLPARQVCTGAPWAIAAADLEAPRVVAALSGCRSVAGADPNQGEFGF